MALSTWTRPSEMDARSLAGEGLWQRISAEATLAGASADAFISCSSRGVHRSVGDSCGAQDSRDGYAPDKRERRDRVTSSCRALYQLRQHGSRGAAEVVGDVLIPTRAAWVDLEYRRAGMKVHVAYGYGLFTGGLGDDRRVRQLTSATAASADITPVAPLSRSGTITCRNRHDAAHCLTRPLNCHSLTWPILSNP